MEQVSFGPAVVDGIRVAAGSTIDVSRSRFEGMTGTGVEAGGEVHLANVLMTQGGTAIRTGPSGFLDVRFATITGNSSGIDNGAGGTVAVAESIVYGNSGRDFTGLACTGVTFTDATLDCAGQNGNLSVDPLLDAGYRL